MEVTFDRRARARARASSVSIALRRPPPGMEDPVVASHGDAVLRASDVDSIRGRSWLTDAVLSFYAAHWLFPAPRTRSLVSHGRK